jgi:hypothetical protein
MDTLFTIRVYETFEHGKHLFIRYFTDIELLTGYIKLEKRHQMLIINPFEHLLLRYDDGEISIIEDSFSETEFCFAIDFKDREMFFKISNHGICCRYKLDTNEIHNLVETLPSGYYEVLYDETTGKISYKKQE